MPDTEVKGKVLLEMDAREENEDPMEMQDDQQMEENNNQDEEMQDVDTRSESCVSLSDDEEQLLMGHDDELDLESIIMQKPLSEEEINELISDLVGVESKAAEAQKAIEEESLAKVEGEVREKLARTLRGVELDKSVSAEMTTFKDVWEETLDNLEVESANLLEQLDGAGVELPKLYKMIESQAPSRCHTEFWKKRTHWVGTQVTEETVESLANAETFLHTHRPVRKRHGILLEEGASGFLEKKFADDGVKESLAGPSELDWSSLNKVFTEKKDEAVSFGSKNWASVYSASTPQQAAAMGFEFPGVNEVEEIEEIDAVLEGTFFADAMENERELALAEEQKKNYKRDGFGPSALIPPQARGRPALIPITWRKAPLPMGIELGVIRHEAENSDDESACLYENNTVPNRASIVEKQRTMSGLQDEVDGYLHEDWWVDSLDKTNYKDSDYSGKMILLLDILTMCADVGDKALVFSQSIPTLDLIELYLSRLPRNGKQGKFWKKGKDWYRIDGKTVSSERQKLVDRFNEPENKRVKCTLISTRAESLGINLYAANRVIIVDGSWNPTYDLQAIYGAWRYGQKKPVFAYRLMARGTIEEKIYKPQVTKEGRAARVVDRQQVHRNISKEEMLHLFEFDEAEDSQNTSQKVGCCSDKMMENLLQRHNPNLHEHETLLKENEEEKLTKEEKDKAWEVYRRAFEWEGVQRVAPELQKPLPSPQTVPPRLPKRFNRSRFVIPNCTRTAHQRTFIAQGRKVDSSTVCGECGLVLTWEDVTTPAPKIDYF
ncbi:hypothetical protein YC2023_104381 [Brassica napus]